MESSQKAIDLIKHYEGVSLKPYLCPANIVTIGVGHVVTDSNGTPLTGKDSLLLYSKQVPTITQDMADMILKGDLRRFEAVLDALQLNIPQNKYDALISLIFNIGGGNFKKSTLLKNIKNNADDSTITKSFLMWNKGGGKELSGLTKRRQSEALLYTTGELKYF